MDLVLLKSTKMDTLLTSFCPLAHNESQNSKSFQIFTKFLEKIKFYKWSEMIFAQKRCNQKEFSLDLLFFSDEVYSEKKSEKNFEKYNLINSVLFFEMFKFSSFDYKLVQIKKQIINQSVSVSSEH